MAPTGSNASTSSKLSMKLLVDTKAGRVLYAEAGKQDVIDFLFSLLILPVGTVIKILSKDSMVGSIGNLYSSVEGLDAAYVRSAETKNALLSPAGGYGSVKLLRLPGAPAASSSSMEVVYQCSETKRDDCCDYVAVERNTRCRRCGGAMNEALKLVGPSCGDDAETASLSDVAGIGFVQGVVTYTVMDDLKVAPMSTISGITLLKTFGVTDISVLEEKTVQLGYAEGLEMLRVSLQSKTVLSDVFLGISRKVLTEVKYKKKPSTNKFMSPMITIIVKSPGVRMMLSPRLRSSSTATKITPTHLRSNCKRKHSNFQRFSGSSRRR